ncbi:MAG: S41 family peptidase [Sporomusaceae bacterium]|nr:S41 family peptidase [Sporomusaceae bacterium]
MSVPTNSVRAYLGKISLAVLLLLLIALQAVPAAAQPAYRAPQPEDYGGLAWSEAFDRLHGKFSREYAFTGWKKIDWAALYSQFKPRIDRAQAADDFTAYYLALRGYVHSIPDGHVRITTVPEIDKKFIGGGFGFSAVKLSDGRIIAAWVDEAGAAFAQGLRAGAELLAWNGRPVKDALKDVPTLFTANSATAEDLASQQVRYLTRAPRGTGVSLVFAVNGETARATLSAYDDSGKSLARSYPAAVVSDGLRDLLLNAANPQPPPAAMIEKKILPGNIGYMKIWGEFDADLGDTGRAPSTLGLFRTALAEFNAAGVKGLILDIRNNVGGLDSMVADMLASFYREEVLYEYQNCFNAATDAWEIVPDDAQAGAADAGLYIRPAAPFFGGPVVALVNGKCVSSGEGLAMGIRNLPNGETVGFYGTNGSFGMAGGGAKMPGNLEIHWPFGQSLDKNRQVQIDSRDGTGGIAPSVRTPLTKKNALRIARGEDVELEHAVEIITSRVK